MVATSGEQLERNPTAATNINRKKGNPLAATLTAAA
jgi:hypothetical protein